MLVESLAVVAGHHHRRVCRERRTLERRQHPAQMLVHERDLTVVAVTRLRPEVVLGVGRVFGVRIDEMNPHEEAPAGLLGGGQELDGSVALLVAVR